jgi:hypothetical protein
MALHGAAADAHGARDLGLGQIPVVAQDQRLRCRGGSVRRAATTADRSSSVIAPCSALGMPGGGLGALRSTTIRCRSTDRDRFTTDWRR